MYNIIREILNSHAEVLSGQVGSRLAFNHWLSPLYGVDSHMWKCWGTCPKITLMIVTECKLPTVALNFNILECGEDYEGYLVKNFICTT